MILDNHHEYYRIFYDTTALNTTNIISILVYLQGLDIGVLLPEIMTIVVSIIISWMYQPKT